jgi:hypothetical protein
VRRLKALNDKLKKHNQGHVRRLKALDDKLKKQNQAHVRKLKAFKKTTMAYNSLENSYKLIENKGKNSSVI